MKELDSLFFIQLPENYTIASAIPDFDPSIPLPIQLPAGEENIQPKEITQEMILAGMLTVFAYDRDNLHTQYYRDIFLNLKPNIRAEMTEAAIIKTKNGDFELAEELLLALEGLFSADMFTKLNLALLMEERSRFYREAGADDEADYYNDEAFHFYKEVLAAEPPIPQAFFNAGFFFIKQSNYAKARSVFETYLQLEDTTTDTAETRKQKARDLIDWINTQALDDDLFKEAYDFMQMNQEEKALERIREFLSHHPKVWNAWFLLGWALRRLNRWEDAKAAFLHCLELGQDNEEIKTTYSDICNELSICLTELKEYQKAEKWLLSALAEEPENIKIISNLGSLALKKGKTEEAKGFFRTVLEINPTDNLAKMMLAQLND